ncbi:MAG: 30S ribosomal protein S12 methylthiotransferase RimO [Synechococcaceae cyanobacterium SM2_3_1]|nr:30S ribosomal protein S12 methylthiotransferase RimO [Synechococcaceae cyanobacterium SM2_3_1]
MSSAVLASSLFPRQSPSEPRGIAVLHLGCEKNRVDTEHILGILSAGGYRIEEDEAAADYVIVNTCSFIEAARRESVQTLMDLAVQGKRIVISGCLAQHFQQELLEEIPEAVAVVGTGDYHQILEVLQRVEQGERVNAVTANLDYIADEHVPRIRTTHAPVAYLRIAEGCDYRCAFCIIPHLRGNQRSRSLESILAEAEQLAAEGVQELVLISQITTNYGVDLYGEPKLAQLIRALGQVPIPWIRMLYAYPTGLTPEVLAAIAETPNMLPYLDLPLQHSHPQMLRAMRRPWLGRVNDEIIERLRQALPQAVLRSTFIVGFPGETEEHFQHLCNFLEQHQFDHVGVFTFSAEPGTPAAILPDQIPLEVMQARRDQIMRLQQGISFRGNRAEVGKTVPVLLEQENSASRVFIGRSPRFAPEVDGVIYVEGYGSLNSLVPVTITRAEPYDLFGEIVTAPPGFNWHGR